MPSFDDLLPNADQTTLESILDSLKKVAIQCVESSYKEDFVVAYSSGIDSSILAELVRQRNGNARLLTLGTAESSDVVAAANDALASKNGFLLTSSRFTKKDIQQASHEVAKIVHVDNLSHFEDCVSFWLIADFAAKNGEKGCIFSANGPDELFCGYDRFRRILDQSGYDAVGREISKALLAAEKLGEQVQRVVSDFGFEVREPFMHETFRKFALSIPPEYKILVGNDLLRKRIWRCFGRLLEIPEATVLRRKKAMQYGMGIHPIVLSMVKKGLIKV